MPRIRTLEAINKARNTRAENKRKKEERAAARLAKRQPPSVPIPEQAPAHAFTGVDWQNLPMPVAQQLYAQLKETFERAGKILNARAMASTQIEFYECFMAGRDKCCAKGTKHRMPARGTDYENGIRDPKTGLITPVLICSENCWIRFQGLLIDQRRERHAVAGTL
jgi:hypothetical protein